MRCSFATQLLPTPLYALHCTLATPKNATHFYPLVEALATPKLTFRYRYIRCCRRGPLVVLPELCCQQIMSFLIRSMHFYLLGIFNARRDLMEILLVGKSYRENIKLPSSCATGCDLSHFLRDGNFSFFPLFFHHVPNYHWVTPKISVHDLGSIFSMSINILDQTLF
jgi:hypothetical protein